MKKLSSVILSIVVMFQCISSSFAINCSAQEKNLSDVDVTIGGETYVLSSDSAYYDSELDTYVIAFSVDSGKIKYYTESQTYETRLPEESTSYDTERRFNTVTPHNAGIWNIFVKESETIVHGKRMKVTADFIGPKSGGSVTKSVSISVSEQFSAGVTATAMPYIRSTLSGLYSWVKNKSHSSSYTVNLSYGESGYLSFTPYYIRVYGYYQTWFDAQLLSSEYCYGDSVKLTDTGSEPDGRYEFIYY